MYSHLQGVGLGEMVFGYPVVIADLLEFFPACLISLLGVFPFAQDSAFFFALVLLYCLASDVMVPF